MARIIQQPAVRGSQYWLQSLVNNQPWLLNHALMPMLDLPSDGEIIWRSPLLSDAYAEYQDQAFLDRLGVTLRRRSLADFWPRRGPVWDGLGITVRGDLLLVEAKSHIPELESATAAGTTSLARIQASLTETKAFLRASPVIDWTNGFYQYANRLAHLYLLRELNELPAYLVNIYFINDHDQGGSTTRAEWEDALQRMKMLLGICNHRLTMIGPKNWTTCDVKIC